MELRVIGRGKDSLELEIIGEGHTFCNLLVDVLNSDPEVEYAGYDVSHPLLGTPRLFLRVRKGDPEKALRRALERIVKLMDELHEAFEGALKSERRG